MNMLTIVLIFVIAVLGIIVGDMLAIVIIGLTRIGNGAHASFTKLLRKWRKLNDANLT